MSHVSVVHYASPNKTNPLDRPVIVLRPKEDEGLLANGRKTQSQRKAGSKDAKSAQPVAVARRNARERNRVRQVNNGFANLRQHIPNFIAQAFEGAGRNKKLSKVETLRMAVEYIRSLEDVLAMNNGSNTENNTLLTSPSSSDNAQSIQQFSFEDDDSISTTSTPPPQQLIRINTADNTYEIISNSLFENGENLDPLTLQNLENLEFNQDLSYLNVDSMQTGDSLSPGMYSEDSLSPGIEDKKDNIGFVSVFNGERLSPNINVQIKAEVSEHPVLSLKSENELNENQKNLVDDVISWWDTQPAATTFTSTS